MKKGILLVMFALLSLAGFSQVSWNAKVGMNISNFTGDLDVSAKVGVKLGVGMEYAFNDTWLLQPSLFLSQKGAKFSATVSGNEAEVKFNAMYFELPIMAAARFNVANNTNIVVSAGPYLACGLTALLTQQTPTSFIKSKVGVLISNCYKYQSASFFNFLKCSITAR